MKKLAIVFFFLYSGSIMFAQQPVPAKAQSKSILLLGGTVHIGNGKVIENAAIGFKGGKLTLVSDAANVNKSEYEEVLDAKGKHIYPGFIVPNSSLGLNEVASVRATQDQADVGDYIPHVRSLVAYNSDSRIAPTIRTNGVLYAQVTPEGRTISGTSSIVELDGWNWEDAAYKIDDGVHMKWPGMYTRQYSDDGPGQLEKSKNYDMKISELKKFFEDAKSYNEAAKPVETNIRFEAMKDVFSGNKRLFVRVNYVKEIIEAVHFCKSAGVKKMVIVGGADSWKLTDLLKQNNIPVIISSVHDLPDRTDDDIDQPYKLPYLLQKAGILFCLNNDSRMEPMGARNLPFFAGTASAYGLTKEEALMSVTSSTAKILGIDNTTGSLEVGKDATLFISTGDALDMRSNNVEMAFIRGKNLDLRNEQKALYEKYMTKYGVK